jgi:hypothetical protein
VIDEEALATKILFLCDAWADNRLLYQAERQGVEIPLGHYQRFHLLTTAAMQIHAREMGLDAEELRRGEGADLIKLARDGGALPILNAALTRAWLVTRPPPSPADGEHRTGPYPL